MREREREREYFGFEPPSLGLIAFFFPLFRRVVCGGWVSSCRGCVCAFVAYDKKMSRHFQRPENALKRAKGAPPLFLSSGVYTRSLFPRRACVCIVIMRVFPRRSPCARITPHTDTHTHIYLFMYMCTYTPLYPFAPNVCVWSCSYQCCCLHILFGSVTAQI